MASSSESTETQKKKTLPLFGKRNKVSSIFGQSKKPIPETVAKGKNNKIEETFVPENEETDEKQIEEYEVPKILGPTLIPEAMEIISKIAEIDPQKPELKEVKRKSESEENLSSSSKKKRSRVRVREKNRENVDIDDADELEDEGKNVEWLPPCNQKGDGFTSLNEKYGY